MASPFERLLIIACNAAPARRSAVVALASRSPSA
jgi:hypothetical protein